MRTTNKNTLPEYLITLVMLLASFNAQADLPPGYSVLETVTYNYDASGNRIARDATVSGGSETPIEAQYDAGNRLIQLTLKGQGPDNTDLSCTLSYDPNGNLKSKTCGVDVTHYTWDARNSLIQIQGPMMTADYKYDALGRRIERTVNGQTIQYLYDDAQAIAEIKNGAVSAHILTGLQIDEVIARYSDDGERTLLKDALGSVLIAAKEDATITTAYGYSPYGETQLMGTDEYNPIQYTARENDDTGLYYYRARYYDPQLKRFISEDPIGIEGGRNVYAYVEGNPISRKDPTGEYFIYVWQIVRWVGQKAIYGWVKKWVKEEIRNCFDENDNDYSGGGGEYGGGGASGSYDQETNECEDRKTYIFQHCVMDEGRDVYSCYNEVRNLCQPH